MKNSLISFSIFDHYFLFLYPYYCTDQQLVHFVNNTWTNEVDLLLVLPDLALAMPAYLVSLAYAYQL